MSEEKIGYRLWSFKVDKSARGIIEEFCREFKYKTWLYLYGESIRGEKFYYVPVLSKVLWNSVLLKGNGNVRVTPLLRVKFVEDSRVLHGSTGAPVVFDLSRREVRFKRRVIAEIPQSTVKAVKEDIRRFKELKFIAQFNEKKVHLIAFHDYRRPIINSEPFLVIAIDVNSRHGFTIRAFLVRSEVRIVARLVLRPPNHSLRWKEIRKLQHLYDASKKYEYYRLLKSIHAKIKRLNREFRKEVVFKIREIIRQFNVPAIIVIDIPYSWSLEGTGLQKTLMKTVKAVKNLAFYENTVYIEKRVSGKRCPLCNSIMRKYKKTHHTRLYQCTRCNLIIDRDTNTCYRLCLWVLKCFLKKERLVEVFREKIKCVRVLDGF